MDGVSDRVPTPTPLEVAVHDFLARDYPTVTLGAMDEEFTIVPAHMIGGLRAGINPAYAVPRAHVSIDPGIKGGAPCIAGTRLTAEWMAGYVWDGWTFEDIRRDWDYLTRADVLVACWYVAMYGSRTWRTRWGSWAEEAFRCLWDSTRLDECPWPPTRQATEARQPRAGDGERV